MFASVSGFRHASDAWARAARTWGWAEECVAISDHSARRRRLLCCLRARKVSRRSEVDEKYHREWASTVASKVLTGGEVEEGGGSMER